MWPAFVVLTLVDGFLIHHLFRRWGRGWTSSSPLCVAMFGNLVLSARWPLARAPDLDTTAGRRPGRAAGAQLEVLADRIGTALLVAGVLDCSSPGSAARPLVVAETDAA